MDAKLWVGGAGLALIGLVLLGKGTDPGPVRPGEEPTVQQYAAAACPRFHTFEEFWDYARRLPMHGSPYPARTPEWQQWRFAEACKAMETARTQRGRGG